MGNCLFEQSLPSRPPDVMDPLGPSKEERRDIPIAQVAHIPDGTLPKHITQNVKI